MEKQGYWRPFKGGSTVGTAGSEAGLILRDEEHAAGARITLERDARNIPFAITCGIYGLFLHTCYRGTEDVAHRAYEAMKRELTRILDLSAAEPPPASGEPDPVLAAISCFVENFPT